MSRHEIVQNLIAGGAIAVIRMNDSHKIKKVAEAVHRGGIAAIEVTMTTPNALKVIEESANSMGDFMQIGVGSVLDAETARKAINAGATFVVSPIFKPEIIQTAHRYDLPAVPGAFTPTEILTAHEQGADIVKVFPADVVGMAFFKAIKAPMPHLQLMPTGGVTIENAGEFIKAGACCVGIGSNLLDKKAIESDLFEVLTERAKRLVANIKAAHSRI
ncbi:MAG: bifunctional 4-hydroxy-2-oxoglutarate aldolase/2-dehydro-3-deoxy-phosphogluconate aldolase [bacterium]